MRLPTTASYPASSTLWLDRPMQRRQVGNSFSSQEGHLAVPELESVDKRPWEERDPWSGHGQRLVNDKGSRANGVEGAMVR